MRVHQMLWGNNEGGARAKGEFVRGSHSSLHARYKGRKASKQQTSVTHRAETRPASQQQHNSFAQHGVQHVIPTICPTLVDNAADCCVGSCCISTRDNACYFRSNRCVNRARCLRSNHACFAEDQFCVVSRPRNTRRWQKRHRRGQGRRGWRGWRCSTSGRRAAPAPTLIFLSLGAPPPVLLGSC